jgi:hypothetical protein
MPYSLMTVHVICIIATVFFFLITLFIFVLLSMAVLSSRPIGEEAGNLMILALIPPSILSVIFLRKVIGTMYDRMQEMVDRPT